MILRRVYLYLVSAAALTVLAAGLVLLGGTVLLFVFNDPSADSSRGQLATFAAMTVVALPVWGIHFFFAQRFAMRDPYERTSALRRLYLYWACLAGSLGTMIALNLTLAQGLEPVLDSTSLNQLTTAQLGWATVVFAAVWGSHFTIAWRDHAAGEEGSSATLRRWYMYVALLVGLLSMLAGTTSLLQAGWTDIFKTGGRYIFIAGPTGLAIAGALLWGFHARVIATRYASEDRHSTLRALEGFIAVAISIAAALIGASQILYYGLARAIGVHNPGGVGDNVLEAVGGPASQLIVYGVAWVLIRRRLARDAGTQEADRQAGVRRLYTNLAALISLAAWAWGAGMLLWTLGEQLMAPIIGVNAADWRDPVSISITLLAVGAGVWIAHWRPSPWAADRQSLSRRLYVWAALLGSVLAVLAGGVGIVNAVLRQAFSDNPRLNDVANLDFAHYLAVIVVAAAVGIYHWRVLRADSAARPPRAATAPSTKAKAPAPATSPAPATAIAAVEELGPHSRRYTLVVTDATDDDLHSALATLPPQASYKLTQSEQTVDEH